jgi:FtsP/CotA-like multicopper oxidase with cupredoxin domain
MILVAGVLAAGLGAPGAQAAIPGVTGPDFNFTAQSGYISTPEGGRLYFWGYADSGGSVQYPGPTMIVNQGDAVTVTLTNQIDTPVSMVFPGQSGVTAQAVSGAVGNGLLTMEAGPAGAVRYSFVASNPGTYMYHSGTRPDIQIMLGMVGALIVRPAAANQAYNHPDTRFDQEYLFLLTEMDPTVNYLVEQGKINEVDNGAFFPVLWFLNGRCAPDTMGENNLPWLPTQPYNCMPMMMPGEKLLMRVIGGGRDVHPFHHHGNNALVIARDGRMLASSPSSGPDRGVSVFTIQTAPGQTVDAIFGWTGEKIGWDIYGHKPGDPMEPNEYAPDHGKPFPVVMPEKQDLSFGVNWSGSPFLGAMGSLPPGQGSLNEGGSYYYMWHSHTEKEMVNNDVFPGGMMTMLMIMPHAHMEMKKSTP